MPDGYTIVVGVSATSKSPTALRWAAQEAALRGGRVVAVRAWHPTAPQTGSRVTPGSIARDADADELEVRHQLAHDVDTVLGPGHGVEVRLVRGSKHRALLDAARGASLLVIDAPRRLDLTTMPGFAGRIVYAASCPVVVMPPGVSGSPPSPLERAAEAVGRSVVDAAGRSGRPGMSHPSPPS